MKLPSRLLALTALLGFSLAPQSVLAQGRSSRTAAPTPLPARPTPTPPPANVTPPPAPLPPARPVIVPDTVAPAWETRADYRTYYFEIPAPRGLITDRNGVPFAQTRMAHHLSLTFPAGATLSDPQLIELARANLSLAANLLGRPVQVTTAQLLDHYRERRILPFDLATFLSNEDAERIRPRLAGNLALRPVYTRFYPQGKLAAHIIGYVGKTGRQADGPIQNNELLWPGLEGREGLEKSFNDKLSGRNGVLNMVFDNQGRKVSEQIIQPPVPGENLITTLDANLQRRCEEALAQGARRGAMVFMDPRNGDLLAMASWPSFDPNLFVPAISNADFERLDKDPDKPLIPRAFRSAYPAGSTFKVFIGTAALEDGVIRKDEQINSPASITIGNITMGNSHAKDFGALDFDRALTMSINTYFYQVAMRCGADRIVDWMTRKFAFGQRTGLPLEEEDAGNMPTNEYMRRVHKRKLLDGDLANLGIGQGDLLVTPIQMCNAFATVANGGRLVKVRLVQQVQSYENRITTAYEATARRDIGLSRDTHKTLKDAMIHVVSGGTGTRAGVPGVKVAGKTGTAQWGGSERRPDLQRYAAWFGGFAPADDPKYAFAAIYESERGQTGIHGGRYAAPMIGKVLRDLVRPDKKAKPQDDDDDEEEESDSENED